jgi:hypothetical protein
MNSTAVKPGRFWIRPKHTTKEMGEELRIGTWNVHIILHAEEMK